MTMEANALDVTVVGAGVAGMAASIHLAKAGLRVVCIEADVHDEDPVGESLDWSAPGLLEALGLPMDALLARGIATYKRHVILKLRGGTEQHYVPSDWLAKPPFNVELNTIHVDRTRLDGAIREILLASGVRLLADRVVRVERDGNGGGRRVTAVVTGGGERIASRWYVDASGSAASLFPRVFQLPLYEFGPRKVAVWDYFDVPEALEGTTLHADGEGPPYMEWVWQIPIHAGTISVGYISTGEAMKEKRQQGQTLGDIYEAQLRRYPELGKLLRAGAEGGRQVSPRTTSFRCRAYGNVAGPNWVVVGESAAMVDPMTSNGVTSALRHAAEAAGLIVRSRKRASLPWLARTLYSRRVLYMARFFNTGIERVIYDWPIRNRVGALTAGDVYTIPAWSMNNIYSRIEPRGVVTTLAFGWFLSLLRGAMHVFYWFCRRWRTAEPVCVTS